MNAPKILGILNITEDSFSDGGKFLSGDAALAHGRKLVADGADIIDIGPSASNPDAIPVSPAEEIRRLALVMPDMIAAGARVSVDSFQGETQIWALQNGAAYINDIHGFPDASIYPALVASPAMLIAMHAIQKEGVATREKGDPATIWDRILSFFALRLKALEVAGIARERMILDPGMGLFLGAGREVSLKVLREISRLKSEFGLPVLISVSRKSFLRALAGGRTPEEAGPVTLAAELFAAAQGVDYIRTHDVRALKDALAVAGALQRMRPDEGPRFNN
ncbi:MAG TPA: dihydropteroate synthase [Alphaproteobacteria bacterium]|nr:dihydropteroate synthase [Alphaproteobacteria bacterium]